MKIAAGLGQNRNIVDASKRVDFEVILTESEDELIRMLLNNEVDAALRGSLSASNIIGILKEKYSSKIYRASFLEACNCKFLFAPVGIDEGDNLQDKAKIIELGADFLFEIGIEPKIAILSGGRPQDIGRSPKIDDSIEEAINLTEIIKDKYCVKHYFILIEDAIKDNANFILAPDGISGNLIFRSLVFLGSGKSFGAIVLGIDKIFLDTSRSQTVEGYIRALEFSYYLARLKSRSENGTTETTL
ncbi:MAG: methanogenesis marker protein Mmp4/MtxX [Methanobacteriaceae archaeon]|jgi:putative methanogen marker protein 4